jgi:hypothetical protein
MDNPQQHSDSEELDNIVAELRLYVEKRIELISLTISEQVSLIAARSIQQLIGILLIAAGAFFLWFGVGFLTGDLINNTGLGFLIASIPVLLFGYIFLNQKSAKITENIQAELIHNIMENVNQHLPSKREEAGFARENDESDDKEKEEGDSR